MPIPSQTEMFLFTIKQMKPGVDYPRDQIRDMVRNALNLSEEELREKTKSGVPIHKSRTNWSISWLSDAGFIDRVSRGVYHISPTGMQAMEGNPSEEEFGKLVHDAREKNMAAAEESDENRGSVAPDEDDEAISKISPEELLSAAEKSFHDELAAELMAAIMDIPGHDGDVFFEQIVTDLLVHIGYGEGRVTPASNDGGIDGIIKTDPLGFDPIFIQAKRYSPDNTVGRPAIQAFAGALGSITRGAFITTSTFQKTAVEFAKKYPHADIVLIDGARLTDLMIEYDLGVTPERTIHIKRIDADYFDYER